ncbi:MAG: hypothetical protein HDQ87_08345 [Clostridia bacterium]|nr:hypothetical protein [Clostridia bacterium]
MRREKRGRKIIVWAAIACAGVIAVLITVNLLSGSEEPEPEPVHEPTEAELMDVTGISLAGRKIIVDAGHGGFDAGCTGVDGRLEKEVNLEIAQRLQTRLIAEGAEVIMTRTSDDALAPSKEEDMDLRKQIITDSNADAFVSIHQNQYEEDPEKQGPQVFYAYHGTAGKTLALAVQDMMNYQLEIAEPRMALDVPYDVLIPGSQPSCTVECGFFSNPEEEARLQTPEYQEEIVDAIVSGIKLYYKRTGAGTEILEAPSGSTSTLPSLGSPAPSGTITAQATATVAILGGSASPAS